MLIRFKEFLNDNDASYMYITGAAGTGKTTKLAELVQHCIDNKLKHIVCAYTHKAVNVLSDKMPNGTCMSTLHKFLKKRPTVNVNATKMLHLDSSASTGDSDFVNIVFIDEFSMIGSKDYEDIKKLPYKVKIVFIGDLNQLPPVKDSQQIFPIGYYWIKLTKIYRQASNNKLLDTLSQLASFIEGADPTPLIEHETFIRNKDIVKEYKQLNNAIVLCYTNENVQKLNRAIEGKNTLSIDDYIFSPTNRHRGHIMRIHGQNSIKCIYNCMNELLTCTDKYGTLKTLKKLPVQFVTIKEIDENGNEEERNRAIVFGHYDFIKLSNELKTKAVKSNKAVEKISQKVDMSVVQWARLNADTTLAKNRAKAWKDYLAFNSNVICIDFAHAMTVHKSQGSTYENVLIDIEDLGKCADKNYKLYMQLLYVAISRASHKVITN